MAIKIEFCETTRTISVGNLKVSEYNAKLKKRTAWVERVLEANNIKIPVAHYRDMKGFNKGVCDAFGCSSTVLHKHFVKLMNKAYIVDLIPYVKNRPYTFGKSCDYYLKKANQNYSLLKQLGEDGLYHLGPIVAASSKSPENLREELGKGAWKKIANASPTRVGLFAANYHRPYRSAATLKELVDAPSSILKVAAKTGATAEEVDWLIKSCKGSWGDASRLLNLKRDYKRMAESLGVDVVKVTAKNVKHEHDLLQREFYLRRDALTLAPFNYERDYKLIFDNIKNDTYNYFLPESGYDLIEEGREMRHCVGSYVSEVRERRSLILSIRKDGERYSTVEFCKGRGHEWYLSQNYMKGNRSVDCSVNRAYVSKLLQALNDSY